MSRRNTKSHLAVERHLEERAQYEAWIAKLDSGASAVPAQVLDRVRADYRSRLDRVTRELARYEKDLETSLAESEVRRDDLVSQRTTRSEALAETELRHLVGEYDDAKFHEQSAEAQVALAQLAEEIAATERDIAKFEEILGLIAGALPEIPAPEPAPGTPPPTAVGAPPKAPAREPAAAPPSQPVAPPAAVTADVTVPPAPTPPPGKSPEPSAPSAVAAEPGLDELAFLRSVMPGGDSEPGSPPPAPPAPAKAVAQPAEPPVGLGRQAAPPNAPVARVKPEASKRMSPKGMRLTGITGEPDQGSKTLRCTECGTPNLPTEWYCEKCGAELSAF